MNSPSRAAWRTIWVAIRTALVLTAALGIAYPLAITGAGQLAFPAQANGSIVKTATGDPVGSALLGQQYLTAAGAPDPAYFQPRPSGAGTGYDGAASGASNLGPESAELAALIQERRSEIATFNGVQASRVPADAVTASASGLDPHISAAYAELQLDRVAQARGIDPAVVRGIVSDRTTAPDLGFLGETRVNVLELNTALDALKG